jgi:hypothetical protein
VALREVQLSTRGCLVPDSVIIVAPNGTFFLPLLHAGGHFGVLFVLLLTLGSLAVMVGVVLRGRRVQRHGLRLSLRAERKGTKT